MAETNQVYKTRQRDLILEVLKKQGNRHLTAQEVTDLLHKKGTAVGKSTVYRYLEKLAQDGIVKKYMVAAFASVLALKSVSAFTRNMRKPLSS